MLNWSQLMSNPGRTWYLPHHPVLNSKNPDEVRIIFDCATVYANVSHNRRVFQGQDLNNEL